MGRQLRGEVGSASHSESIEREWVSWEFSNLIAGFLDTASSPDPTPAVTEMFVMRRITNSFMKVGSHRTKGTLV